MSLPPLERADLLDDPVAQFALWFEGAAEQQSEPQAAALATATPDGRPAARMVLVKQFDERGFVFLTNYDGRKGRELAENPWAALLFHWDPPGRQVRIEGPVERTDEAETAALVRARSRESRIVSMASQQSAELESREQLAAAAARIAERYAGEELPVASGWGGYRVRAETIEFWQQGEHRFHDRFRYSRTSSGWSVARLYP